MVMNYLNLFRWKNLLISGVTILISKYAIFEPAIEDLLPKSNATLNFGETLLLSLSVMIIAAAGYVVNDINDVKSDEINKPLKVIVGKSISINAAKNIYLVLNAIGLLLALFVANLAGNYKLVILHLIVAAILWIYSSYLKNSFLIGNLLISIASALVPVTYLFFESLGYIQVYGLDLNLKFNSILGGPLKILFYFSVGLSIFGFLISFIREIIKDLQDYKGDYFVGAKTIPIVLGEKWTKIIIQIMSVGLIVMISYANFFWLSELNIGLTPFTVYNCIFPILLLVIISSIGKSNNYQKQSDICKVIMTIGILSPMIYAFNI